MLCGAMYWSLCITLSSSLVFPFCLLFLVPTLALNSGGLGLSDQSSAPTVRTASPCYRFCTRFACSVWHGRWGGVGGFFSSTCCPRHQGRGENGSSVAPRLAAVVDGGRHHGGGGVGGGGERGGVEDEVDRAVIVVTLWQRLRITGVAIVISW